MRRLLLGGLACSAVASWGCGGAATSASPTTSSVGVASASEKGDVHIDIEAERSGHSLIVFVKGVGLHHPAGTELEDPKAWRIDALVGEERLKQVLAGPARVAREPSGNAMSSDWDVSVEFSVAFALPDSECSIDIRALAPSGRQHKHSVAVESADRVARSPRRAPR